MPDNWQEIQRKRLQWVFLSSLATPLVIYTPSALASTNSLHALRSFSPFLSRTLNSALTYRSIFASYFFPHELKRSAILLFSLGLPSHALFVFYSHCCSKFHHHFLWSFVVPLISPFLHRFSLSLKFFFFVSLTCCLPKLYRLALRLLPNVSRLTLFKSCVVSM